MAESQKYQDKTVTKGAAVANYLFCEKSVCVAPASIYGSQLNDFVKVVICNTEKNFQDGIRRLQCDF
jgi:aspartate/methionine/tyrosine aminotransferase